jgi:hypothetical protein
MQRGRPKAFETPEELWAIFEQYCTETKSKPIIVKDWVGPKAMEVLREKECPLTFDGFTLYIWKSGVAKGVDQYFTNPDNRYENFVEVCSRIKQAIREDQIRGGMAGIYNPSITQRLNNLVERQENTVHIEQPLFPDND